MAKVVKYTFCVLCIVIVMSSLPGMAFVFGRRHKTAIAAAQNDGEKPPQQQMTTTAMPPTATTTDKLKTDTSTKNQTSISKQNLQSATSAPKMFEQKATTSRPPIDQAIPPIQQQHKQQQGQQQQQQGQMEGAETATKPLPCGVECSPKGKRAKSGEDLLEEIKKEGSVISNERKEEDSEDWDPEIENKDNKIGLLPKAPPEPFNQPSNYGENAAPQTTFKPWLDQKSEIVPPRQTTEPDMHGTLSPTTIPTTTTTTTTMHITTPMPPATTTQTKTTVATSQPTTHPLSDAEQWKAQLEEQAKETKDQTKGAYKVLVKLERYLHSKRKEIKDGSDEEKKEWEREGLPRPRYRPQRSIPTSEALAGIYQEEALTELRQKAQKRNREKAVKKAGDDDEVEATEDDTSEILGEEEDDEDMKTSKKHHKTSRKSKKKHVHHREKTSDAGDESDLITFNEKGEVLSDRESDENNLKTNRKSLENGDDKKETETDSDRENDENKEEDKDEKESDEDKNEEDEDENEGEDKNSDAEKESDEEEKENDEDENDEEDADANPDIEDEVDDMDLSTPKDEQDKNPAVFKEAEREEIASDENGQVVASYDDSEDKKQSHGKKSHKSRTKKKHKGLEESERESEEDSKESDSFGVDNTDEPNGPIKVKERLEKLAHRLPTGPDGSVEWREPHLHSNCWYHAMTSQDQSFSPSCNQDGTYSPKQCHRQRCWCVSQDGKPHEKSAKLRFYYNIRALMLRCIQNEL